MSVRIYTSKEVQKIMDSGEIAYQTHMTVKNLIRPGVSTLELDQAAERYILSQGGKPSFKGFHGYPGNVCISVNEEVVHGIPNANKILQEGDIVSVDIGVLYNGYFSDTAWTWPVGKISDKARDLVETTQKSLFAGIRELQVGNRIGAVGEAVQTLVEKRHMSVVRALVGHGVGKAVHEDPQIPNYGSRKDGMKIRSGMVVAVEPMINLGTYQVVTEADGWTVTTEDRALSAHFEHTIAITSNGPVLCTLPKGAEINVFDLMEKK